ncbi:MAG: symmetrical bis(5'-nucleosyl)-tetraphosphatase [Pseudomonadota bacterium]
MAVYAVGDLQGCLDPLQRLLERLAFDPARDRLWLVGDLVNRGPQSLEALRFVRGLGEAAVTVLGNHDLHLLAVAIGGHRTKGKDTLAPILTAPDRDELVDWLRRQPLLHHEPDLRAVLAHAGIPPDWDLPTAAACARQVEAVLAGDGVRDFLVEMYGDHPDRWDAGLEGLERLRYTVNALTRMRYLTPDGRLEFKYKCAPERAPEGLIPWYAAPRAPLGATVVFGHWSTLGRTRLPAALALDTGCLWGGKLTAVRLDDASLPFVSVDCAGALHPGAAS